MDSIYSLACIFDSFEDNEFLGICAHEEHQNLITEIMNEINEEVSLKKYGIIVE